METIYKKLTKKSLHLEQEVAVYKQRIIEVQQVGQ